MKIVGKLLLGIIEFVIIIYVVVLTSCLLFVNSYGYTQLGNYTLVQAHKAESQLLKVNQGDLLIIKKNNIKIGSSLYYYSAVNDKYFVKNAKVINVNEDAFGALYTVDVKKETATITDTKVIGDSMKQYHNMGKLLDILESKVGFLLLVLLPIMCIFIYHVYTFVLLLKFEKNDFKNKEEIEVLI